MATEFRFPDVGEGITEGEIVKWRVKVGDVIKEHDILGEIETDKAVAEIPSPVGGTVLTLTHKEGEMVQVGEVIAIIGNANEAPRPVAAQAAPQPERRKDAGAVVGELPEAPDDEPEPVIKKAAPASASEPNIIASPATRKLARDLNVDLSLVFGTGPSGRITDDDVKHAAGSTPASEELPSAAPAEEMHVQRKYDFFGYVEHIPLRGVRKATAKHMAESIFTATHVTHMDEIDVTDLWMLREKEKTAFLKRGLHLTFLPFVVKAVVKALKEYPYLNASLDEQAQEITLKKYYNIGIAVDIEGGLLVPVVKNIDSKNIADISREIQDLAAKARDRKLDIMDMKGGTFTITNIGSIGGIFATPIINYPEVAILALGKIMDKPMVRNGAVVIRKIMPFSLAFDHRVLDGAEAARFATRLIQILEDPEGLLLE